MCYSTEWKNLLAWICESYFEKMKAYAGLRDIFFALYTKSNNRGRTAILTRGVREGTATNAMAVTYVRTPKLSDTNFFFFFFKRVKKRK